jgi:hypothetical protein
VAGLYRSRCTAAGRQLAGLWLAHSLFSAPYVLVALAPAWRGFDPRYEQTARALGRSRTAFWWRAKLADAAAPMAAALAVGFAVSVAQYLPTQFVGAGRHATVTTEAVTLAAGGQRTLPPPSPCCRRCCPRWLRPGRAVGLAQRRQNRGRPHRRPMMPSNCLTSTSAWPGARWCARLSGARGARRGAGVMGESGSGKSSLLACAARWRHRSPRTARCASTAATSTHCPRCSGASACCSRTTCCFRT